jgi:hypothetical protein
MFFSVARYNFTVGRTIRRLSEGIFGSAFSCGSLALLMPGVVFLRGERVTLRTIEEEDAEILQRAYNEPAFQVAYYFVIQRTSWQLRRLSKRRLKTILMTSTC